MRCREILDSDLDAVADFLTAGFRTRDRSFWEQALARQAELAPLADLPRFGYLLVCDAQPVGVLLTLFSRANHLAGDSEDNAPIRCNLSSWYVAPDFRAYAPLLVLRALRHGHVTFTNLTSIASSRPILEAQGFRRYCAGTFYALPALAPASEPATVRPYAPGPLDRGLTGAERKLLADHAGWGCLSLVCEMTGECVPFVLTPRVHFGARITALLAYCRNTDSFLRCARPIGRYLAQRGCVLVGIDADQPIPGLPGVYRGNRPKFYRGPTPPRAGDLAYSERVMFGS